MPMKKLKNKRWRFSEILSFRQLSLILTSPFPMPNKLAKMAAEDDAALVLEEAPHVAFGFFREERCDQQSAQRQHRRHTDLLSRRESGNLSVWLLL